LAGFTPVRLLGSGGYADVFLYEQHMPNREVAVKVLVNDTLAGDLQRRQFTAEANLMARVSAHPYIVTIFQADVASDGRPYIVMEYYPGDNYLRRARHERFGVAEMLRVGIQVGSALETAHRAGILHRDIKPANILTSEFRRPGLADFGIASAQGHDADDSAGVSIPWSPPEAFGADDLGIEADVYSLAATLYHLLAGRSPFEVPGGDNSALGLMSRIERNPVPPLGRPDVPSSLERLLVQAMAKRPQHRPASVVELLRQLQGVEAELKLAVTPLELADDGSGAKARSTADDDDATRVKGVTEIQAQVLPDAIDAVPANPTGSAPLRPRRREGLLAEPEVANTLHRPTAAQTAGEGEVSGRTKYRVRLLAGVALAVVIAVVGVVATLGGGSKNPSSDDDVQVVDNVVTLDASLSAPPQQVEPFEGVANADGSFTFTWSAPDENTAAYHVLDEGASVPVRQTTLSHSGPTRCIDVATESRAGLISAPVRGCAP
jgi:tRNA A-37 threonylcarbamoyl transferase component Bud32